MPEYFCVSCEPCWEKVIFMLTRALFTSIDIGVITSIRRAGNLEARVFIRYAGPAGKRPAMDAHKDFIPVPSLHKGGKTP
jgi:hypothetical protein